MSQILGPALASADPERMAEITRHDLLAGVNPTMAAHLRPHLQLAQFYAEAASQQVQERRAYLVVIGTKHQARLRLPVMARSASEAQEQHECLMLEGERCDALPYADRRALRPELDAVDRALAKTFAGSEPFPLKDKA